MLVKAKPKSFYYFQLGIRALNKLKQFLSSLFTMDSSSQPPVISPSVATAVPAPSPAISPQSSSASILPWPQPSAGGHTLFNPNNTPLLQPSSDTVYVASAAAIIFLFHTHQVISLKLTNTNYLY